jgi:hypothetical protein
LSWKLKTRPVVSALTAVDALTLPVNVLGFIHQ